MYKVVVYHRQIDWYQGQWHIVARSLIEKPGHLKARISQIQEEANRLLFCRPDRPIYTKFTVQEFELIGQPTEWSNGFKEEDNQLTLPGVE